MKIFTNNQFDKLKLQYTITSIKDVQIDIPKEVQEILEAPIIETEYGICLKPFENNLGPAADGENSSIVEDNANHFHIDYYANPKNERTVFKLGVKTIYNLVDKFQKKGFRRLEFSYSFHTKKMAKQMDIDFNLTLAEQYYFGDRLSFNRIGKKAIRADLNEFKYNAMLIIEI